MMAFQEAYDGSGSGLVGGLALGIVAAMLFLGAIVFMAPTRPLVQQQVSATRYVRRACQIQVLRLLLSGRRWSRVVQCHSRGS